VKVLILDKAGFQDWLRALAGEFDIIGPAENTKGLLDWNKLEPGELPDFRPGLPKSSIKTFFFPQPETLLEFSARPGDDQAFRPHEPSEGRRARLLAGVRPCDARSVALNSMPYASDPYFLKNRENVAMVGLACTQGCSTCFCTWTGGSPVGSDGMDVMAYPLGDAFALEPVTGRGKDMLLKASSAREAAQEDLAALDALKASAPSSLPDAMDPASVLREKELMSLYNASFWQGLSESCLNCGTCTFLCPTCYCFDIQDETLKGKGRRIRYWDSCMFPLFTLHASGHNPRGEKVKRVRNRFMHKLKYFPDRFGPLSCVGCGRCVRDCPVNIDIRQVMKDLLAI